MLAPKIGNWNRAVTGIMINGHHLDGPVQSGHADAVVAHRANQAGDERAVKKSVGRGPCWCIPKSNIHRIASAVDYIDAVHVIDVTVAIIINAIGGLVASLVIETGFAGIAPHVRREIGMSV